MTSVSAPMGRAYTPGMFGDLTGGATERLLSADSGTYVIEFDAELDEATAAAIRERMASRDDDDQANRAALRAAADEGATNLAQMLVAYTVGDPLPAAVISE